MRIRKGFLRRLGTVLLCVALSVGALTAIARWTDGSYDIVTRLRGNRNPDNLLTLENYTVEKNKSGDMEGSTKYGVTYKVKDDGRIVLSGKNNYNAETDVTVQKVPFASVTLKAGTYTISGYEKAQANTLGVYAMVGSSEYSEAGQTTFTVTQETTVVIGFYVCNGVNTFGKTLYPVLVSGEKAGSFYTK